MNLWTPQELCDSVRPERINAVIAFGFTERQARFLVHVLVHAGVVIERQYRAFAHITHGQNTHDFLAKLVSRGYATAITPGALHRGRLVHVQYKPLYEAIGEPNNRNRKPASLGRFVERLMLLDAVLADRHYTWLGTEHDKVAYFVDRLQEDLPKAWYPHLTFGEGKEKTTRYFPEKLPIGVPRDGGRPHVFLYLVTREVPAEFRLFLLRHADLLKMANEWTIRLLVPRRFRKAAATLSLCRPGCVQHAADAISGRRARLVLSSAPGPGDRPGAGPGSEPRNGRPEVRRGALPRAPSAVGTRGYDRPLVSPVHESPRPDAARMGPRRNR